MLVLCTGIHFQLLKGLAPERIFRKHAFYSLADNALRILRLEFGELFVTRSTRIQRVVIIRLLLHTLTGHLDLRRIDDDHEIANIGIRCELRFMLTAKYACHTGGKAADCLVRSIYNMPLSLDLFGLGEFRL